MVSRLLSLSLLAAGVGPGEPGAPESAPRSGSAVLQLLVPLIIVFAIMYLFVIGPQRKREKQRRAMLDAITKGAEIVTIGGIYGKVLQAKEKSVVVMVGDNVKMTFSRGAIARVVQEDENAEA